MICGGVHGRMIDLRLVEVSALGGAGGSIDELRNAACIQATEDHQCRDSHELHRFPRHCQLVHRRGA